MSTPHELFKAVREARRLSQAAAADLLGHDQSYVSRLERGRLAPSLRTAKRIERLFEIPFAAWFPELAEDADAA